MKTFQYFLYCAAIATLVLACKKTQTAATVESGLIAITNQQFTTDSMELGRATTRPFENTIKCNGHIATLPNGLMKLNATTPGIIDKIYCQNGQKIEKGQVMLEISGNEVIDLQREFAEASANYIRLKNEYERLELLYNEKVTSEKDFATARNEFVVSKAKYNSLKLKVEALGLPIERIVDGEFQSSYAIKAPIGGRIINMNATLGAYVTQQTELLEIVDPSKFEVILSVFAKEISHLEVGQTVRYQPIGTNNSFIANLGSIGVTIDQDTKTVQCHAPITNDVENNLIANQLLESEIITAIDTVIVVPSEAILKTEEGYYILTLNKKNQEQYLFNKVEVQIGREQNGFTEIKSNLTGDLIAIKGVYNIQI